MRARGWCVGLGLVLSLAAGSAWGQWEFNWVPSGTLDVGEYGSEAAAQYEADGQRVTLDHVAFRGESAARAVGRRVTGAEAFVIRPASYRLGPAPAHLVIAAEVDTGEPPTTLTVTAAGEKLGTWRIGSFDGPRRLTEVFFVIPKTLYDDVSNGRPLGEVPVTLTSEGARLSLGYRFFAADAWDVLGVELAGDLAAAVKAAGDGEKQAYLQAVAAMGDRDYERALSVVSPLGEEETALARHARFLARLLQVKQLVAALHERDDFDAHYRAGLLAGAWGAWPEAASAFKRALELDPLHADATYRYAEALEYCRRPVAAWSSLFERAGMLGEADRGPANVEDVLLGVYPFAIEDFAGQLSAQQLAQMQRDWRYCEQMVYGASLGAWKVNTHWLTQAEGDPDWVMQAGWIFLPPDEVAAYEGQWDYSIGTAGYGSSHAGGVDCGVAGSGGAQIGPTRGWEVWLHEWNHQFDWVFLFAESGPGYPVTHDSDGCGKQPIVSMGCGHRSSMRYYVTPRQYQRHRASDQVQSAAFIDAWQVQPVITIPPAELPGADALLEKLVETGSVSEREADALNVQWQRAKEAERRQQAEPFPVPSSPEPAPVPDWDGFVQQRWLRASMIDEVAMDAEERYVRGGMIAMPRGLRTIEAEGDFVDGKTVWPQAGPKAIAYARTFVYVPETEEVRLWCGFNDTAHIWVNGRPLMTGKYYAVAKWEDANRPYMLANYATLARGWNSIVVKLERGGGDWGFGIHVVDFENQPIEGLRVSAPHPQETVNVYAPPAVGPHYAWDDVKDDYLERLPRLTQADLRKLTGLSTLAAHEHKYYLTVPDGDQPVAGARYVELIDDEAFKADRQLNNYLNWDWEAAAALRYEKDGATRDLLLVRPEYYEEFLALLTGQSAARERLLGYWYIEEPHYPTVPNRSPRAVLVVDAQLPDYPRDDLDLLGVAGGSRAAAAAVVRPAGQ